MNQTELTLQQWLKQFPVQSVRDRVRELQERISADSSELASLRAWLDVFERSSPPLSSAADEQVAAEAPLVPAPTSADRDGATRKYPPKGKTAIAFLGERPGAFMTFQDIRRELINRDLMGDSDNEMHALRVALYKAHQSGALLRDDSGAYALPTPGDELRLE